MATSDKGSKQEQKSGNKQSGDTSKRGFASMDPEQQREIAAEGGRAAHEKGTAHEFTSEEARKAGALSHKNDPGRNSQSSQNSQSASSGSAARSSSGNKGSASEEQGEAPQDDSQGGRSGGSGSRSKS